jgi:hypothetical protein
MPGTAGHTLVLFQDSAEFGEIARDRLVVDLPPETILYKSIYLNLTDHETLRAGRERIAARETWGREDIHLLRPAPSTDGPPFRSVLIYQASGEAEFERVDDPRIPRTHHVGVYRKRAIVYEALRVGSSFVWESDLLEGRPGFFLTGTSESSSLWRLARVEADALDREVLTLVPVRLPHAIPMGNFDAVEYGKLRQYQIDQFTALQRAVAAGAHLDVVDRAHNVAEGVLAHCLAQIGLAVPPRLFDRLQEARKALEDSALRRRFLLSDAGYHRAHTIRLLHARAHEDQAAQQGGTIRPEVGMGVAIDVSELLVQVGLARY